MFTLQLQREHAHSRKDSIAFYAEARRRSKLVKAGKVSTVSHETVMQGLRQQLAKRRAASQSPRKA
jgi:hypothetical protein